MHTMMHLFRPKSLAITLLMAMFVTVSTSCRKERETIAIITVKDKDGNLIQNAEVRLWAIGSPNSSNIGDPRFDMTVLTNASGIASFDFTSYYKAGQSGFAVLDVEVKKNELFGKGLIRIEEEKTNEETIIIK
jgi:hypothetical protein